jgi:hypothetical protein
MKKIILRSKLSEDDALSKLGVVSKDLLDKGLISKGDELVAGVEEKDGGTLITINADLMTKEKYKDIKAKFLEVGEVLENDLKNFDDDSEETPKDPKDAKDPKNEDTHEEQKAVDQNSVKTAEAVLHDTSDLLFDINPNQKSMDELKTLLFSEEEIKKAPESEEKRPADPAAEEKKPEAKEHDDDAEGKDKKEPEAPKDKPEEKKEVELHDLLFSDEELITFDSLLFSDEELKDPEDKKEPEAPKAPEVKEHDAEKKECPFHDREEALKALAQYRQKAAEGKELTVAEKYFCEMAGKHFSEDEVKEAQEKVAPKAPEAPKVEEPKKPEVKEHDDAKKFKVLCPEGKTIKDGFVSEEEAKKYIEENKIAGATVAEMKEHDDQPKVEEPKKEEKKEPETPKAPEAPKAEPKPEEKKEEPKEESKMDLIRRLNKENSENTLLGRAKDVLKRNK